jgi:tRNA nucleotidyltransferase (CCA-adding enzyme)
MDLVLCHRTADFDTLGAAVGLARLQPGTRIVLSGGSHPAVRDFLALYRDEYPLIERRSVNPEQIRSLTVVDTQQRDLLGKTAEWLDQPELDIVIYDHHLEVERDIPATQVRVEAVGATTTLMVEQLQAKQVELTVAEATAMALGIHVDTGSLTYDHTTVRDAAALTWLMAQGASQRAIAEYIDPGFSAELQELLSVGLEQLQTETVQGYLVSWLLLITESYTPGMSHLASHLLTLTESDSLLLGDFYQARGQGTDRLTIIGRSQIDGVDLNELLKPLGGGGHPRAAAVTLKTSDPQDVLAKLLNQLKAQIPQPPTARELMSSPVRTIRPDTTVDQAQRILLRYGHSGLSVVNTEDQLVGIISRRDLDIALHHGFSHAPVKGYMTAPVRTISPDTLLPEIESLMVTYDIGRLPVLEGKQLVGIVTRTDILRQLHQLKQSPERPEVAVIRTPIRERLQAFLSRQLQQVLSVAAAQAEQQGWQLYLVGGAVRDLLLAKAECPVTIHEFDLVVDGVTTAPESGAGIELARALQQSFPETQLQIHGQFQTAALRWPPASDLSGFAVDIATARTEFYPYPAANPEVAASSIRQDLYRRDFTINALAVRLSQPRAKELLDFFGGLLDLQQRQIRVLHPNSFIEDPTRIFRAVRFAVRLEFGIHPQTEEYIRHAIASGIYQRIQGENDKAPALQSRLRNELKYILRADHWQVALKLLADLGALQCIHPALEFSSTLWRQMRLGDRWLKVFDPQEMAVRHWEMLVEMLIAYLDPEYRGEVAENLHLSVVSLQRLQHLAQTQTEVVERLSQAQSPSQIVHVLRRRDLPTLILIAAQDSPAIRSKIWQYLRDWAQVKPLLNGDDLIRLGYKPGPHFKAILDKLLSATLDGVIRNQAEALALVSDRFPN